MNIHLKTDHALWQTGAGEPGQAPGQPADQWPVNRLLISDKGKHDTIIRISGPDITAWFAGDPVLGEVQLSEIADWLAHERYGRMLQQVGGHYRFVLFNRKTATLTAGCSLFHILPFYYRHVHEQFWLSSNPDLLATVGARPEADKRFVLENILFYYPLFNRTAYKEIQLLPANTVIEWGRRGMRLVKHTEINHWLTPNPQPWNRACERMASLFVDRVKHYLPAEPYMHSLTGGFDSRTLVATALFHKREFGTYSFGTGSARDLDIAQSLSQLAQIPYKRIDLGEDYVNDSSYADGLTFVKNASGSAGFARAHYLFACRSLAAETRYLVTGNFGSEIFRAAHNAGSVISPNLYRLLKAASFREAVTAIEQSETWQWLNPAAFRMEWESLKADLYDLPVFKPKMDSYERNRCFYQLVFEEVFRKYFGAEMQNQYHWLANRTPFLDPVFLQELLKTGLAGVYARFFDHNPFRRFKGQVLYAHIIRQTYPPFGVLRTDKGYRPNDLLSLWGKAGIAKAYVQKRWPAQRKESDPHSVIRSLYQHWSKYEQIEADPELFRLARLFRQGPDSHEQIIALSQAWHYARIGQVAETPEEAFL